MCSSVDENNLQLDEVGCLQLAGNWVVNIVRPAMRVGCLLQLGDACCV